MVSLLYKNSFFYNFLLKILHGKNLKKRYKIISELIGKNKKMLEIGCGTSLIYPYLDKSNEYEGWDLNKNFINESRKKGLNVKIKNCFDYKSYPKVDVILIIDVLHHIFPRHEELIKHAKKKAKKVIIAEPYVDDSKIIDRFLSSNNFFLIKIARILNFTLGDNDGVNNPETRFKWNYDKKSLESFFKKMGSKKIIPLGNDLIASL